MRKHFNFFCFVFSVVLLFSKFSYGQVQIVDPNLRSGIEKALGKSSGEPITEDEMETLTGLEAHLLDISNVSDLTGIEYAVELKILNLAHNNITDISVLSNLTKLASLSLEGNLISDIVALSDLSELEYLNLSGNKIIDISALSNLKKLSNVNLSWNQISDLSPLSDLSITWLGLSGNQISDLSPLSEMISLGDLSVDGNQISDISALSNLTGLSVLTLRNTPISDVSALSNLLNLRDLYLNHTSISDISALSNLSRLTELHLGDTPVSDISVLSGLTNLSRLDVWDTPISDISVLSNLSNLTSLYLTDTLISDISALSDLTKLTWLRFDSTFVSDISALSNLTELTELGLKNTLVTDISALSSLTRLRNLHIQSNSISDISPLVENTGLGSGDSISINGNLLNYPSLYEYIPALQARGVQVYFDEHQKRKPTTLNKVSDDPLVVVVRDENEAVFEGVPVNFAITEGKGVIKETAATDNNGRAQAIFECNSSTGFNVISASVDGIEETLTFDVVNELGFDLALPLGVSFIHVPLEITEIDGAAKTIETIGDLYDVLGGEGVVNLLITYNTTTQRWSSYSGARDRNKLSDRIVTDELGIIASVNNPVSLRLRGVPLGVNGQSSIMLCPGLNLVGIPLNDSRITRVSDILQLEGIVGNSSTIIVYDDDGIKVVAQANDDGDIDIKGGQSFIVIAQESAQIDFEGGGWSNTIEDGLRILEDLLSNK